MKFRYFLLFIPALLRAHAGKPIQPHDIWTAWTLDPLILASLAIPALLYARGLANWHDPAVRRRAALFASGWLTLAVALISPVHKLGEALFSAHMVQHELFMLIAAPLLIMARPGAALLRGLPVLLRRPIALGAHHVEDWFSVLLTPFAAWLIHAAALWIWHIPLLFEKTLDSELWHTMQHASFFGSALLFWWSLAVIRPFGQGQAVLSLFTTAVHSGVLGALLTLAQTAWYPSYAETAPTWGLTPLEDQQLGGLIMWVPAGVLYVVGGLAYAWLWLRESEARATAFQSRWDRRADAR